ncbi:hypothetical protein Taro_022978 [Colocasia esculenta]|uniref:Uncharacterized protein n=1 Tax=Colocasia esculenta TaxID=4460 RepID=A0A843V9Y9_COLES|nr:hypothetical protein [Colocasia esculenta]
MHRMTVPHSLLTSELVGIRDGFRREELPVCPKPRRAAAPLPEFLSPLSCKHRSSKVSLSHAGRGIFEKRCSI